jgi:threonine/homoserine/homoserine lactone efflux protein
MILLDFIVTIIILSASGALAPGPLFVVTISHGTKTGIKSGLLFSIAHSVIEFTLVMLLALGLLSVTNEPIVRIVVGIAGGAALIIFGSMQILNSLKESSRVSMSKGTNKNLFLMGLTLTGLNPYFIVWWLSIGANLILYALEFAGLFGVILMYFCHVWIDYAWLTAVSGFAKKGAKILEQKWYRILLIVFGIILIYFGLSFLIDAIGI